MPGGRLPASGTAIWLREPTGEDEVVLLQGARPPAPTMLSLVDRLATSLANQPIDWEALPAADLGAAAMLVRRGWLGDLIRTEALCGTSTCDKPLDISFSITSYLDHHQPRRFRGAITCEQGWFALRGADVRFRIPTIADLLVAGETDYPVTSLLERCVRPSVPPARIVRRIDRALEALAPRLDGTLTGTCPSCQRAVEMHFEPIRYVLEELRWAATGLYAEVHELAFAYHWSEPTILALDRRRRHGYVAMIRGEPALV